MGKLVAGIVFLHRITDCVTLKSHVVAPVVHATLIVTLTV